MKLQIKIWLAIIPLISIPLLIVGIYAYSALWQVNDSLSKTQVESYLNELHDDYQARVFSANFALNSIANDSILKQYLQIENDEDRYSLMYQPMIARLTAMQLANPNLYEIRLILLDGVEELRVVNENIPNISDEEMNTPFFKQILSEAKNYYEFIGFNPDVGKYALYVTIPIKIKNRDRENFTSDRQLKGYLSITQRIDKQISPSLPAPWEKGRVLLIDKSNLLYTDKPINVNSSISISEMMKLSELALNRWQSINMQDEEMQYIGFSLNNRTTLHVLLPNKILLSSSFSLGKFVLLLAGFAIAVSIPLLMYVLRIQVLSRIAAVNQAVNDMTKEKGKIIIDNKYNDEIGNLITTFNNMSVELFQSNEKIKKLAYLDSLTSLPNRFLFHDNLKRVAKKTQRDNAVLALLYLDLDNFKNVNDTMGHPVGDLLLQKVAKRLRECLRSEDMMSRVNPSDLSENISRLGGDEFTILIPNLKAPHQASTVASRIVSSIAEPFFIDKHVIYVSASIGISLWPNDTNDVDELIAFSDQAMYQAKNSGRNKYKYFSPEIGIQTKERAILEQHLYRAIDNKDFTLHYQPIVDSLNYKIQSYEALIRWTDEELGVMSPAKFIPLAEENGSILKISEWVLEEMCQQIKIWRDLGYKNVKIGMNLSAKQINSVRLTEDILATLYKHKIFSENIYFELTESSLIQGEGNAIKNIERLRSQGYQIALDDFGTGYSSLNYLQTLPIDILKIDRSFISNLSEGNNSKILTAIITVAKALNLKVIAEGIEHQGQLAYLPAEKDIMMQGYLFSRPRPASDAVNLLESQDNIAKQILSENNGQ